MVTKKNAIPPVTIQRSYQRDRTHFVVVNEIENIISQHSSSAGSSRHGSPTNCSPSSIAFAMRDLCSDEVTVTTGNRILSKVCIEAVQSLRESTPAATRAYESADPTDALIPREADPVLRSIKCPIRPENQIKLFYTTCHQVICRLLLNDCGLRSLEGYVLQSVGRMNDLTVRIKSRCEKKMEIIMAQKLDLASTNVQQFGIVITQKAGPQQSGIEHSAGDMATLNAHKLTLVLRNLKGRRLGHCGVTVQQDLRFRDDNHLVPITVADNRDGTCGLFVSSCPDVMHLMLFVDGKLLEE
uniref:Uncharacterized protein n=1 Tax=Anopheles arabiensis TaxID=7173 RepID=A0A182HYD8_ANOAR